MKYDLNGNLKMLKFNLLEILLWPLFPKKLQPVRVPPRTKVSR